MSRRLVVEADGGSRGNPGPAAWGALVRDADTGELLVELAEAIGTATNNVAEYSGLVAGLRAAREIDADAEVEVRMDSKLAVEQMAGRWQIKHPTLRPLARQARDAFPYEQVTWTWVPRKQNAHADRLLNAVLDEAQGRTRRAPVTDASGPLRVDEAEIAPATPTTLIGWADLGEPTTLLLLRHGETELTVQKRFSGSGGADPALSDLGRAQAERAADALVARGGVEVVITSPLRRAVETAGVVADRLGVGVRIEEDFREAAFGAWDGLTFAEVRTGWPDELDRWLGSPSVAPPDGESLADVSRRVARARDRTLVRYARRTVLVVTHVTPVTSLVRLALDAPPNAVYRLEMRPGSLSEIAYYADGICAVRGFNHVPPG